MADHTPLAGVLAALLLGCGACSAPDGSANAGGPQVDAPPHEAAAPPGSVAAPPPDSVRAVAEQVRGEDPALLASQAPRVVRPSWYRLVLTGRDGSRRVFTDEVVDGDLRWTHVFRGAPDGLDGWVVERRYHPEGRQLFLVDGRTAEALVIDEMPVASPSGRRFTTASLDLVAGHLPNRIRIYRAEGDGWTLEWEAEPREWGGRSPVWLDEDTIRLERGVMDWDTHELRVSTMLLKREGERWTTVSSGALKRRTAPSDAPRLSDRGTG